MTGWNSGDSSLSACGAGGTGGGRQEGHYKDEIMGWPVYRSLLPGDRIAAQHPHAHAQQRRPNDRPRGVAGVHSVRTSSMTSVWALPSLHTPYSSRATAVQRLSQGHPQHDVLCALRSALLTDSAGTSTHMPRGSARRTSTTNRASAHLLGEVQHAAGGAHHDVHGGIEADDVVAQGGAAGGDHDLGKA